MEIVEENEWESHSPASCSLSVCLVLFSSHLVFAVSCVCVQVFHERVLILTTSFFPGVSIPLSLPTSPGYSLHLHPLQRPAASCSHRAVCLHLTSNNFYLLRQPPCDISYSSNPQDPHPHTPLLRHPFDHYSISITIPLRLLFFSLFSLFHHPSLP